MKNIIKYTIITIFITFMFSGCSSKKENMLKQSWILDNELKPKITLERSKKNEVGGIFYTDSQIEFNQFLEYIKTLSEKGFEVDWRYSDTKTIEELENAYTSENSNSPFNDGYINFRMCSKDENKDLCIFMQWADKKLYNKLHKDKPTSYSFKLETEKKNINISQ